MSAKRVLICTPVVPEFDRESGSQAIVHFVEFLQEAGWAVSLLAHNATGGDRYARLLRQRGVAFYAGEATLWAGAEYVARIDDLVADGRFDLAIFAFWYVAEQYMSIIRHRSPGTRLVVDSIDLHFLRHSRRILRRSADRAGPGLLDERYADEMIREINTYAQADAVLTRSQKEADMIGDLIGNPTRCYVAPDSEDLALSPVPAAERRGILFVGNFRHPPNGEAVEYLCREIVPRLDPAVLGAHPLCVVGNGLNDTTRGYARGLPGIHMVGWVPSVVPYLQRARVSVIPLLHGAGTKRKLLQALMIGTPSVSTSIGVEGFDLRHDQHVLVADGPVSFADAIARLLDDGELWQRLTMQGRQYISARHGRAAVGRRLLSIMHAVLAREAQPPRPDDGIVSVASQSLIERSPTVNAGGGPVRSNLL